MSWLYAQTWLWYLIAFVVGVLLAWLLLVLPQQRRLRTLRSVAGTAVGHDLYAESRPAVGVRGREHGAALFDSTAAERAGPATATRPPTSSPASSPATARTPPSCPCSPRRTTP